jgi:AraC-like DNA-binding protein
VGAFTTYRLASTGAGQLRAMMILMPGPLSTNRDTHPLAGSWNALTDAIGVFADTEVRGGLTAAIDAGQSMLHLEVGEALDSLLARATDQGVRATRQSARGHAADARLLRAYSFLRDRITEPLELGALANVACMSKYHLVRLFARAFSYTPRACQMEMRLALAKSAIMRGASLFRATHDSGFADQSHLTRRLKASLGLTPGALARQCATPWVGGAGIVFHSRPARLVAAAS